MPNMIHYIYVKTILQYWSGWILSFSHPGRLRRLEKRSPSNARENVLIMASMIYIDFYLMQLKDMRGILKQWIFLLSTSRQ